MSLLKAYYLQTMLTLVIIRCEWTHITIMYFRVLQIWLFLRLKRKKCHICISKSIMCSAVVFLVFPIIYRRQETVNRSIVLRMNFFSVTQFGQYRGRFEVGGGGGQNRGERRVKYRTYRTVFLYFLVHLDIRYTIIFILGD